MDLQEYNKKRDFNTTPEPIGDEVSDADLQRFVVQRHKARKLHYDLRLEINGTLKSWAVPKGPSMNPDDKRLAVRTEDHPLKYLSFRGIIPKGNYGAGEMSIWDNGTFEINREELDMPAGEQLVKGNLKLIFYGKYLKGHFALVRTGERGGKESWLLIKKKDIYSTLLYYDSELLIEEGKGSTVTKPSNLRPQRIIKPMLASVSKKIFNDPEWVYELKWDGYRVLAHLSEKGVLLQSRNGINLNTKFSALAKELDEVPHEAILDGEVVVVNEDGVSQFGEIQNYPDARGTLRYYVFDMLYLNGHSMLELPLLDRKSLIPELLEGLDISRYCDHIEGMGTALFKKSTEAGMEGVMAKRKGSTYTPGTRTENWLKVKTTENIEVLICGYTDSVDKTASFGSLILGLRDGKKLTYIGNCGSGFSDGERRELFRQFGPFLRKTNPFEKKPALKGRKPNWMVPTIECEVIYSERTKNGLLRNPIYKRLIGKVELQEPKPVKAVQTYSQSKEVIEVDGFSVPISNLDKMYWPESGITKYDLIDFYLGISHIILPHLIGRPQSLHRHPNGILEEGFYQKDYEFAPEWMESIPIYSKSSERNIEYLLCQDTASLLYLANLGCIEINPWNSRVGSLDFPDYGIIDLDPPEDMHFSSVIKIALEFKKILDAIEIEGFCKTSGSKGLHIYLPMGGQYIYQEVRNFIKLLCYTVEQSLPKIATLERSIKKRDGKVYLDYLQNRKGHTIASVYSVRPLPEAPVSTPVAWEELHNDLTPQRYNLHNLRERLDEVGDLFRPLTSKSMDMADALKKLDGHFDN